MVYPSRCLKNDRKLIKPLIYKAINNLTPQLLYVDNSADEGYDSSNRLAQTPGL